MGFAAAFASARSSHGKVRQPRSHCRTLPSVAPRMLWRDAEVVRKAEKTGAENSSKNHVFHANMIF